MTLLPPLKYIRSLRSVKLPKLSVPNQPKSDAPVELVSPVSTPATMMEQIGGHLCYWRTQQSRSIEEVAALTQIQPRLIQAIEEGHIEMLPESVYVKGMIRRYGDCLGMDGSGLAEHVPTWQREVLQFQQASTRGPTFSAPTIKPIHWYIVYALTLAGGSAVLSHLLNNAAKPALPVLENAKNPIVATPMTIAPSAPIDAPETVKVRISVKNPVWVEIVVDDNPKVVGNLKAGDLRDWVVTKKMTIRTNDGGGLFISQGQQPFKAMGQAGQKQQITIKVDKKTENPAPQEKVDKDPTGDN